MRIKFWVENKFYLMQIFILDIPFETKSKELVLSQIDGFLQTNKQHQICTPNPEFLLESLRNPEFKTVLQNSAFNVPDGTGILWAATVESKVRKVKNSLFPILYSLYKYSIGLAHLLSLIFYPKLCKRIIKHRITGTDLMKDIFEKFPDKKIFLLGAKEGVAEKASLSFPRPPVPIRAGRRESTGVNSTDMDSCLRRNGSVECFAGSPSQSDEPFIISKINHFKPDILFVAFGAPNQDLWISRNLSRMPSVKIAIGVGGAFDFWAGIKKRAPKIFQIFGLEWMFRLFVEPKRWKRICNAVIVFPWKFLQNI